jgi:hypothetical protein
VNKAQVVPLGLLVSRRDAAVVLDSIHEAFDEVSGLVLPLAEPPLLSAVAARRDHRFRPALANCRDEFVRVISFVGDNCSWYVIAKQFLRPLEVVFLARSEEELERLSLCIDSYLQLRTESAPASAEGFLTRLFLGAPAAC